MIETCKKVLKKYGMCLGHLTAWDRLVRNRKPTKLFGRSDLERFEYYVMRNPSREIQDTFGSRPDCWVWRGSLNGQGYGLFASNYHEMGGSQFSHLFSLSEIDGVTLTSSSVTDHLCRFRPCANPKHLERVSHRVNTLRGVGPTAINARKETCDYGHDFTPENTRVDGNGHRECITCIGEYHSRPEVKAARREKYEPITGVRGSGQYMAERKTCSENHPLEGDNLIQEKKTRNGVVSYVRRCRTCRNKNFRENHAKRNEAAQVIDLKSEAYVTTKQIAEMLGINPTYLPTYAKRKGGLPGPAKKGSPSYYLKQDILDWMER
jgi:hypothetical protein